MNKAIDVIYRLRSGLSQRQISKETGISRKTINKYFHLAQSEGWLLQSAPLPAIENIGRALGRKDTSRITEYSTPVLEPYKKVIAGWLEAKYTRKRMLVLLRENYGVVVSYDSIKRFCRRLRELAPHCRQG